MLKVTVETITEELAAKYLATQTLNRTISETVVRKYRNEINAGRWALNGHAITFDDKGSLIDGQHRCRARIGATRDFETLVVRGVDPDARWSMDQGRVRSLGQQLAMAGIKDGNVVGSGTRLYLILESGVMFRDNKVAQEVITTPLAEKWALDNRAIIDALHEYREQIKDTDAPPSVAYAAAIIFHRINPDAAREFFRTLSTGAGGAEHPITVLDKRLQRHRREGLKISSRDVLGLYIQTWNAWIKGRTLTKFQRPRGGHWTEATFPRPIGHRA